MKFKLRSNYQPRGDQPAAIDQLVRGVEAGDKHQVLLGVTGSGKTFTMAKVIEALDRPALVLAHNEDARGAALSRVQIFFSTRTPSNISSATTITTSRAAMCRRPIFISTKNRRSTTSSTNCA